MPRSWPKRRLTLRGKLILLVAAPALALTLTAVAVSNYMGRIGGASFDKMSSAQQDERQISRMSVQARDAIVAFDARVSRFISAHQAALLQGEAVAKRTRLIKRLKAKARMLDWMVASRLKSSMTWVENHEADEAGAKSFLKRVERLQKTAKEMPRLLKRFAEANAQTLALIENGDLDGARLNYVQSEKVHAVALREAAARMARTIERHSAEFKQRVDAAMESQIEGAKAELSGVGLTMLVLLPATFLSILVLSMLAVRGMVSRPLFAITTDMTRLAQGDLSVQSAAECRSDELGDMARALAVFRRNAVEKAELAEKQRVSEAAVAAERQRMMAELRSAFGSVVSGAVAGDFSGRVPAEFPDEELNELASGVNRLLETVKEGVGETGRVLERVANGDLQDRMQGAFNGAFAELQSNVNGTVTRLSQMLGEIAVTTDEVRNNAEMITDAAVNLAGRAEQQAASLEETSAAMEEMSKSIKSNAGNSDEAQALSVGASQKADRGGEVVREAVSAMGRIEESATKINDIISVIDGIAFQTNLLALNAAVEAARAGEAGKGFAVVAQEVRALAQRSADAARDVRGLIENSGDQISAGVRLVSETGESLEAIVAAIVKVNEAVDSIASTSKQQALGVSEISATVTHMDELTQQNASLADDSANGAHALSESARRLEALIAFFRIGQVEAEAVAEAADEAKIEAATKAA